MKEEEEGEGEERGRSGVARLQGSVATVKNRTGYLHQVL